jgi:hypothetical protein
MQMIVSSDVAMVAMGRESSKRSPELCDRTCGHESLGSSANDPLDV